MLFKNNIRKETTPKRVFAIIKLIRKFNGKIKTQEIEEFTILKSSEIKDPIVSKVLKVCVENNFIKCDHDYNYSLILDDSDIKDFKSFRKFVSKKIFEGNEGDSQFLIISKEILTKDLDFYDFTGFEDIANQMDVKDVDKEFILAWRFWAEFIGMGKIMNSQFLINPYQRIYDLVILEEKAKTMSIAEFILKLLGRCPEFTDCISENRIGLSLSTALRTLEEMKKIKIIYTQDSVETWELYSSTVYTNKISDIEVIGD